MKKVRLVVLALVLAAMVGTACLCIFAADAPSVKVMSANLSLQDNVYMYFSVAYDNVDTDKDTCGVIFWTAEQEDYTLEAAAGNAAAKIVAKPNSWRQDERLGKKLGVFTYGVSAKEMTDTLYVQAYAQVNGQTVYGTVISYSPVIYAERKLGLVEGVAGTTDEKLKDLLVQMLRYGAAAQVYFDYHTERLATDILQGETLEYKAVAGGYEVIGYTGTGERVVIPARHEGKPVVSIGRDVFENYTDITSVSLPEGLLQIKDGAFRNCTGLTSITIPESVTSIGDNSFSGCTSLTEIVIPNSVISIGGSTFSDCTGLTEITLPFTGAKKDGTGNTHFGYIFGAPTYDVQKNYLPESLKTVKVTGDKIDNYAFYGCSGLTNIIISDSVTSIEKYTFAGCKGLTSIIIPDSVTSIGNDAFENCTGLTSITIPNSVTRIEKCAFYGCTGLTHVTFANASVNWRVYNNSYYTISVANSAQNALYLTKTYLLYIWTR